MLGIVKVKKPKQLFTLKTNISANTFQKPSKNWVKMFKLHILLFININDIYANLTMMTILSLNHFWVIHTELCLKSTSVKATHVRYHILDIYENPWRKNFINPFCRMHPETINWNKKWHKFCFHTSLWCVRKVSSFWATKKKRDNKNIYVIFPLIPLGQQGLGLRFVELPTYAISVP